ncbi:MAG: membrane protein insertion efficiency factor YidD [Chromatiales bacterium]|nr:membrane protein insertion efficiency factor YidD [Chromatiales bacterium]
MVKTVKIIGTLVKALLLLCIKAYRYLWSPLFPSHCRFYPSCSAYASEAINKHGALIGLWLTIKRLLRCHPFSAGGLDPVPPSDKQN